MTDFSPRAQHHVDQHAEAVRTGDLPSAQQHLEHIAHTGTDADVTALGKALATAMNLVDQHTA